MLSFDEQVLQIFDSFVIMSNKDLATSSKERGEQSEELLMSQQRKYPEVFRWKIAVIVIVVLTAIILVVDLIMFLYLKNHELRNNNYTFAADLVNLLAGTNVTRLQFVNLISGLTSSYSDIWFQTAVKVKDWSAGSGLLDLNRSAVFFATKVTERLTLIRFTDGVNIGIVGAFTHIPFQLPTDTWSTFLGNSSNSYFNFQIDDKQSTLFGSSSSSYLKMNGTANNLVNCKIISLDQTNLDFILGASITLSTNDNPKQAQIQFLSGSQVAAECFSTDNYNSTLQQIIEPFSLNVLYDLVDINTYELST